MRRYAPLLVLLLLLPMALIGWRLMQRARAASHDIAMFNTSAALRNFVEDHAEWPRSWQELMPEASEDHIVYLSERVTVDWSFDLDELRELLTSKGPDNPLTDGYLDRRETAAPFQLVRFIDPPIDDLRSNEWRYNRLLVSMVAWKLAARPGNVASGDSG